MNTRNVTEDTSDTQQMIIDGLKDKIKESSRKCNLQQDAIADLDEKVQEVKDRIRSRQQEINEMKRNIEALANKGQQMQ